MGKAKARWSYTEDRRLIHLARSGKSLEIIADEMKRPVLSIRKTAMRLGISLKPTVRPKAKPKG